MAETYTYTARNAYDPEKVVTFTLYDGHLRVNLTGLLEDLGKITSADDKADEAKHQLQTQAKPTTLKVIEKLSGPIHVRDAYASLDEDEHLRLFAWKRVGGLRLAPLVVNAGKVDNPEAAEAFVEELEERSTFTEPIGRFFGPLDYWIGWIGMLLGIFVLFRWPRRQT